MEPHLPSCFAMAETSVVDLTKEFAKAGGRVKGSAAFGEMRLLLESCKMMLM